MACGMCLVLDEAKDEPVTVSDGQWWCRKHLMIKLRIPGIDDDAFMERVRDWKGDWQPVGQ